MQTYKTIPQDERQKKFFARYGKYAPLIALGVILAQLLSGFTESGLIFSNVKDATAVFGTNISNISGVIGALVGVLLIEIVGLRIALPGFVDAILYKRWKGLDLAYSIFLILLTLALLPSSTILSLKGGGQIVENMKDKTEQKNKSEIEEKKAFELASIKAEHDTKELEIKNTYKSLTESTNERAAAKKVVAQQNYDHWKSKGSRYKTKINNALVELQEVEADRTQRIAELKEREALELKRIANTYEGDKEEIQIYHKGELMNTSSSIDSKSSTFKTGTKFIVIVAMCFAVCGITLDRIFKKGSGIEELAEPNNFYFSPSLWSEKWKLFEDKFQIARRNRIAQRREQLPQLTPYASALPVHDLAALERTILELKMQAGEQRKVHYLDNNTQLLTAGDAADLEDRIQSLTQAQIRLAGENHHEAAKVVELQAKEVIKLYLQRNNQATNNKEIEEFQAKVINHLNDPKNIQNPFDEGRKQIGFVQGNSTNENRIYDNRMQPKTDTKIVSQTNLRTCQNCGSTYQYKHHKQKYCKDECRIEFWEKKNGRKLKKKPKK